MFNDILNWGKNLIIYLPYCKRNLHHLNARHKYRKRTIYGQIRVHTQ